MDAITLPAAPKKFRRHADCDLCQGTRISASFCELLRRAHASKETEPDARPETRTHIYSTANGRRRHRSAPAHALTHQPTSSTASLSLEFACSIQLAGWADTWVGLVPSRLGRSRAVDLAAIAVIEAQDRDLRGRSATKQECLIRYQLACMALRQAVAQEDCSDDILLAVALLCLFEQTVENFSNAAYSHLFGINTILASRARRKEQSEMARAIVYGHWLVVVVLPCAQGLPSPFEDPEWLQSPPAYRGTPPSHITAMRQLGFQLLVSIPRLTALVQRGQGDLNGADPEEAAVLLHQMLSRRDQKLESESLQHLRIERTKKIPDRQMTPYSFVFATAAEYEALLHYWAACLLQCRLAYRLKRLWPKCFADIDLKKLEKDASRMARNVLMSIEYSQKLGQYGIWSVPLALVAVFGGVKEFRLFPEKAPSEVRAWLAKKTNESLHGKSKSEDELDEQADLLVGGPLKTFAKTHLSAYAMPDSDPNTRSSTSILLEDDQRAEQWSEWTPDNGITPLPDEFAESMQMVEQLA